MADSVIVDTRNLRKWVGTFGESIEPAAMTRVGNAAGMAGKKGILGEAARTLGPERAMSNFTRWAPLNAGYDVVGPTSVALNMRPKGVWVLASSGRKNSGYIIPTNGEALKSGPDFYRAHSRYGPSKGTGVLGRAIGKAEDDVPKAAKAAMIQEAHKAARTFV